VYFLQRLLMADEVPTGDKAVFAFLEMIALAFAFEGTSALLNDHGWQIVAKSYLAATGFFVAGIKWAHIRSVLGIKGGLGIGLLASALFNYWIGNPTWKYVNAVWIWWNGAHGVWFERFVGALFLLAVIAVLLIVLSITFKLKHRTVNQAPKGFLEYKLEAEVALTKMPAILTRLTAIMGEVGPAIEQHALALAKATTTSQHLNVSKRASSSLDKYSARMRRVSAQYIQAGDVFCSGLTGWSQWIETSRPQGVDPLFREAIQEFIENLSTSTDQMQAYIASIDHMKGVSRPLDAAAARHVLAISPIFEMTLKIKSVCKNTLRILEGLS
jgi:hypothetical protein